MPHIVGEHLMQSRTPIVLSSGPDLLRAMSRFASWLGGQGGYLNPQLKAFTEVDDNGDRGVVAEEDIEEGQQLMLIPLSCCLHMPTQQEQAASQVRYFVNRNIVANHTLPDNAAAQDQYSAAVQYLSTQQTHLSPFLSTVLLLLYEVGQVGTVLLCQLALADSLQHCAQRRGQPQSSMHTSRPCRKSTIVFFVGLKVNCLSWKVLSKPQLHEHRHASAS